MRISGPKRTEKQLLLWDEPIRGHGHVRTIIGDFIEEIACALFNGTRHRTDSRCDYCPDISVGPVYIECKAAGRSRSTFIYSGRLLKDREFSKSNRLYYCIFHHEAHTKLAETTQQLKALILQQLKEVYFVPFEAIDQISEQIQHRPLNSAYGNSNSNPTYGSGLKIRLTWLEPWKILRWETATATADSPNGK